MRNNCTGDLSPTRQSQVAPSRGDRREIPFTAVIIDDTRAAVDNLVGKLAKYPRIKVVATADNGADGIEIVRKHKPDLLFLDVELPDMTGISFIGRLKELADNRCRVVIYTAYSDYMLPAFRGNAFDFLLKPVDDNELDTVVKRFFADIDCGKKSVNKEDVIKRKDGKMLFYTNSMDFRLVRTEDICVFAYDHEARLWTVVAAGCDKPLRLKRSVNKDVLLGIDECFVQVSQKYIININYLLEVRDNICRFYPPFNDIDYVKVGRFFRRQLISRYNSL